MLMVWIVQPSQVCLAVERRADLERRGGCGRYSAKGHGSLMGDAGSWHCPSGGQSLELGMYLRVGRGKMGAEARARGVGRV